MKSTSGSKSASVNRVALQNQELPQSERFRWLGSIVSKNGEIKECSTYIRLVKNQSALGMLCDRRIPTNLKRKFYCGAVRPVVLYGT